MNKHSEIRLPDETLERLRGEAARLGQTADELIRRAVESYLEDLEDIRDAEEVLRRRQNGESRSYTLDELDELLGLDD